MITPLAPVVQMGPTGVGGAPCWTCAVCREAPSAMVSASGDRKSGEVVKFVAVQAHVAQEHGSGLRRTVASVPDDRRLSARLVLQGCFHPDGGGR